MVSRDPGAPPPSREPESRDDIKMPPVGDLSADYSEAFDKAKEIEQSDAEPFSNDPKENVAAAVNHLETAISKLGRAYSSSVVLRLALKGQRADNDFEIADCLNDQVTFQLGLVIYRLIRAGRRLGADIENPMEAPF